MSVAGPNLAYRVCPDCSFPADGLTSTGVPKWTINPAGQVAAVMRYLRDAELSAVLGED